MRIFIHFLIATLLFANMASAAALCCSAVEQGEQPMHHAMADMPCHGDESDSGMNDTNFGKHDCGCGSCVQTSVVSFPLYNAYSFSPNVYLTYSDHFPSLAPDTIYYPPKALL